MKKVLPNKVAIWRLRNNNPLRKSYKNTNIKLVEFEALIKLTVEMSRFLYPYLREILQSRDDINKNSNSWIAFKERYIDLITERFNIESMKVKRLIDPSSNDEFLTRIVFTLALCISEDGYIRLKNTLF